MYGSRVITDKLWKIELVLLKRKYFFFWNTSSLLFTPSKFNFTSKYSQSSLSLEYFHALNGPQGTYALKHTVLKYRNTWKKYHQWSLCGIFVLLFWLKKWTYRVCTINFLLNLATVWPLLKENFKARHAFGACCVFNLSSRSRQYFMFENISERLKQNSEASLV